MCASIFFTEPTYGRLPPTPPREVAGLLVGAAAGTTAAGVAVAMAKGRVQTEVATTTLLLPLVLEGAATATTTSPLDPPLKDVFDVNSAKRQAMRSWIVGTVMMRTMFPMLVLLQLRFGSKEEMVPSGMLTQVPLITSPTNLRNLP